MKVTKTSPISGKEHTLEIDVTEEQLRELYSGDKRRRPVQAIYPNLTAGEREFLLTGITEEEWEELFGRKEDLE